MVGSRTANPSHHRKTELEREQQEIEEEMRELEHGSNLYADPNKVMRYNELKADLAALSIEIATLSTKQGRRK